MNPAARQASPADAAPLHTGLLCGLYLAGIYLGIEVQLPGGTPLPATVAGAAGLLLALPALAQLPAGHAVAGISLVLVAAVSILAAGDLALLPERFKGFTQLAYSILIGYAFFAAIVRLRRDRLAAFFLALTLALLAGSALETHWPAFKAASDAFREAVHASGVYANDLRDLDLYGRVRPKLFTSEPSFLAFGYTLFAFAWYVLSTMRGKTLAFIALLAAGFVLIRGPALVLGILLVPIYEVFLASRVDSRGGRRLDGTRALIAILVAGGLAGLLALAGWEVLAPRIDDIASGRDASFFGRIVAPAIIALETVGRHPVAGVGLTGWEALDRDVAQLYFTTNLLALDAHFDGTAHALTNYFWSMWIFLGLVFGILMLGAASWLLRALGVPSLLFCWTVWILFGQAVGNFVSPRCWTVFFLAAALSVLHERRPRSPAAAQPAAQPAAAPFPAPYPAAARAATAGRAVPVPEVA